MRSINMISFGIELPSYISLDGTASARSNDDAHQFQAKPNGSATDPFHKLLADTPIHRHRWVEMGFFLINDGASEIATVFQCLPRLATHPMAKILHVIYSHFSFRLATATMAHDSPTHSNGNNAE